MEIALESKIPTYSGGLGVLAGDMLRSAADLALPVIGVTMVHRHGYFAQRLDEQGQQHERPDSWDPSERLNASMLRSTLRSKAAAYASARGAIRLVGRSGASVDVLLLDTDFAENDEAARALVGSLYGGDERYRLAQEIVLGYGGLCAPQALGLEGGIATFHMNEGHAALLVSAALEQQLGERLTRDWTPDDLREVRRRFVFTTHTPVPAGHDRFEPALAQAVLGRARADLIESLGALNDGLINMTYLALRGSHYTNGVAMRHGEVSRVLFAGEEISADYQRRPCRPLDGAGARGTVRPTHSRAGKTTMPICATPSASPRTRSLQHTPNQSAICVRSCAPPVGSNSTLRASPSASRGERRHISAETSSSPTWIACAQSPRRSGHCNSSSAASRILGMKTAKRSFAGIFEAARALGDSVRVVYIENYEMATAASIVSGVDVWLNTPRVPLEASGTSGMKAALNGVPSLSTLDGWWVEGCIEGVTGWAIGNGHADATDADDAAALYDKLEAVVVPLYYRDPQAYALVRRNAIALNGSYFNTQRMVEQYALGAYRLATSGAAT